jgi:hypothetical protein
MDILAFSAESVTERDGSGRRVTRSWVALPIASYAGFVGVEAVVTVAGVSYELQAADSLTFGRDASCAVCLDPDDLGISRLAGSIERDDANWWVFNRSSVRPLDVVDEIGIRTLLAPGRRLAVVGPLTVVVEGSARRHALAVVPGADRGPLPATPGDLRPTVTAAEVVINQQDRLALVALFAGYLEPFPRYDPHPRSYADAAARLGWPRTTLVKRIEYLRSRLSGAGVPNLQGENALASLAEWALVTGALKRLDLNLLPPR